MRPVARYRAWALRGPFVLHHAGGKVKVRWPSADTLLGYNPDASRAARAQALGGRSTEELLAVVGDQDFAVLDLILKDLAQYFGCTRAHRLLSLLDRYGDVIAQDLAALYQLDVLDVFRGGVVPDELMHKIDGLPRYSRLSEALAQDDELARHSQPADDSATAAPEVRFTEWTPEAERLAVVADRLGAILSAIAAMAGTKYSVPPEPRPVGALSRLRESEEDDSYRDIVAAVEEAQERWAAAQTQTPEEG